MTDFRDRLEQELRVAADRRQDRRPPVRGRWPAALVPAAGLAAAAALLIALVPGEEPERSVSPPAAPSTPVHLLGTYAAPGEPRQLVISRESIRMIGGEPGAHTLLLGFVSVGGDRMTLRVDQSRTAADAWPGPLCRGGRVGDPGVYRFASEGGALVFRLVDDPCRGRASLLTGGRWRRAP